MRFINRSNNTIYLEDIDEHVPYIDDTPQYIESDKILKSRGFQQLILLGKIEIVEINDTRIERNLQRLKRTMSKLKLNDVTSDDETGQTATDIQVCIKGHFLEGGGYAKVNRNLALGLSRLGVDVKIDVIGSAKPEIEEHEIKELAPMMSKPNKNAIRIDSIVPTFSQVSSGRKSILYTTVESYTIPSQFVNIANMYEQIWVTSDFCAEILRNHGVQKPIFILPCSIDNDLYTEYGDKYDFKPELNEFKFISVFGWSYRKGYDALLRAYCEEFSGDEDVSLLLVSKFQNRAGRSDFIRDIVNEFLKEYGGDNPPHVARCSKAIPESQMPSLYRACDAFILPSRGEGFAIPYCFKDGTKIQTVTGVKNIEDIRVGDGVFSGKNNVKKVSEVHKNYFDGTFFDIKTKLTIDTLSVTNGHKLFAFLPKRNNKGHIKNQRNKIGLWEPEWIESNNITKNHLLAYPKRKIWGNKKTKIDLYKFLDIDNLCKSDNFVWSKFSNNPNCNLTAKQISKNLNVSKRQVYHYKQDGRGSVEVAEKIKKYTEESGDNNIKIIKRHIEINEKMAKLLGYYLAEGSCSKNKIEFAFHSKEKGYHQEVISSMKEIFGINGSVFINKNRCKIIFCSNIVSSIFRKLCGIGSDNKFIHELILSSSKKIIQSFLNGYINGDGHSSSNHNIITISTNSETIARQYQKLMLDMGLFCSLLKRKNSKEFKCSIFGGKISDKKWIEKNNITKKSKETGTIYSNKDYIFIPIESIRKYEDKCFVYNFDVPDDHSYISNIVIAHNCEASLCGLPVIGTNASGQQMFLRENNSYLFEIDRLTKIQPGMMHVHYWDNQLFPMLTSDKVIKDIRKLMREVYENKGKARKRNKKLQKLVKSEYRVERIAEKAKEKLEEIWRES